MIAHISLTELFHFFFFFFQAEDGIRDHCVTGVQTCALPISDFSLARAQSRNVFDGISWRDLANDFVSFFPAMVALSRLSQRPRPASRVPLCFHNLVDAPLGVGGRRMDVRLECPGIRRGVRRGYPTP